MSATAERFAAIHQTGFEGPWSAAEFDILLVQPEVTAIERNDGFLLLRTVAGEAEVLTLAVAPHARRQGLGRALIATALGVGRDLGATAVFLEVAADNPAAVALYRQSGFREVGQRRGYYARKGRPAVDAMVFRCDLNTPSA